jgi:hypothetical protein
MNERIKEHCNPRSSGVDSLDFLHTRCRQLGLISYIRRSQSDRREGLDWIICILISDLSILLVPFSHGSTIDSSAVEWEHLQESESMYYHQIQVHMCSTVVFASYTERATL